MPLRDAPALEELSPLLDTSGWVVLRLDGRAFTGRAARYTRPFDPDFHTAMRAATTVVLAEVPACFAHTASDEISLFLAPGTSWLGGRMAKWLSVPAGVVSAALTVSMTRFVGLPGVDAKVFATTDEAGVERYLLERLRSSNRNARQGYVYYGLRARGLSGRAAAKVQKTMPMDEQLAMLPPDMPAWQRYGALAHYETVSRLGRDGLTGQEVAVERRVLAWNELGSLEDLRGLLPVLLASRPSIRSSGSGSRS
jgi:tRNA(His) 5'-end guanylyltransferase